MSDILAQPEQFKAELEEKWLEYYQANRSWLQNYMNDSSGWYDKVGYDVETLKDMGFGEDYYPRRPECYFILGVVSVLEPSVTNILTFVNSFTSNSEQIIRALGLNFDPEIELKKRQQEATDQQLNLDSQYLDRVKEEIKT